MRTLRLALLSASLLVAAPIFAQQGFAQQAPTPTPEQLAAAIKEDQLSDEKCGVPRNAADDYRPAPLTPDQTRAHRVASTQKYKVDSIASGLQNAWGLAFLPSGNMLVTIRAGGLKTVTPDGKVSELLAGTPAIKTPIRLFGMLDVILDRDFAKNRTIYLAYVTTPEGGANSGYVASAKLAADEKSVTDLKILKEGAGFVPRRIVQGKDGMLMLVTADVITPYNAAQSLKNPNGKVLRINTDGSIPKDNPFVSNKDADPSVYALGVRDPQGMTFGPTGDLYIIENEPRGGDELNLIKAGKNYGFPLISYGRDNDGKLLNNGLTKQDGLEQPIYFWTPSVAFSGMTFYTGDKLPGWKGNAFMGGLSGMQLVRLELNKEGRVIGEEKLLRDRCKRIRDVRQGPDGFIYAITDDANGEILRISPG
ncbi:MAG: PQQ-dependent sugar dehydrogenase [Hyphomonadaceae bacterium]|nr:PQQ-dependent sugar dehydrogenase [Hyphomonadaceae bacterium]